MATLRGTVFALAIAIALLCLVGLQSPPDAAAWEAKRDALLAGGDAKGALDAAQQAVRLRRAGTDGEALAASLAALASVCRRNSDPASAIAALEEAIKLRAALPIQDPRSIADRFQLADAFLASEQAAEAVPLLEVAAAGARVAKAHSNLIAVLSALGRAQIRMGNVAKSVAAFEEALAVCRNLEPPNPNTHITLLYSLAPILHQDGRFVEAEKLYREELAIARKYAPTNLRLQCGILSNVALAVKDQGRYAEAEPVYEEARALSEGLPENDPYRGVILTNMADLYLEMGRSDDASTCYEQGLAAYAKSVPSGNSVIATASNNFAQLKASRGDHQGAQELFAKAVAIYRASGPEKRPLLAASLTNQASALLESGKTLVAKPLFEEALEIVRKDLPKYHPDVALTVGAISWAQYKAGEFNAARKLALEALEVDRRALPEGHPTTASAMSALALLDAAQRRLRDAATNYQAALDLRTKHIRKIGLSVSDKDILFYTAKFADDLDIIPSFASSGVAASRAYDWLLMMRGLATSVSMDLRKSRDLLRKNPAVAKLEAECAKTQAQLADLSSREDTPQNRSALATARDGERKAGRALNQALAKLDTRLAVRTVSSAAVSTSLPPGAVLVEYSRFRPYDFAARSYHEPAYAAFVVTKGNKVRFVRLGAAAKVEKAISQFRMALATGEPTDQDAADLFSLLVRPLGAEVGSANRVVIAPDGALSNLPFAALRDGKGRLWLQAAEISYVNSGSQLIAPAGESAIANPPSVLAGPDYGSPASGVAVWSALPEAASEGRAVAGALKTKRLALGPAATEPALLGTRRSKVLHIATHGYFAARRTGTQRPQTTCYDRLRTAAEPLLRSGLVMAGANAADANVKAGKPDGYATALEIAAMDLAGTRLVVLSACDTGRGDFVAGEGVFGLRRAFEYAGARNLIMSLVKVPDVATRAMMERLYAGIGQGLTPSAALRRAQLALALHPKTAHPLNWAGFVLAGR